MLLFDTGRRLEKAFTAEQFDALVEVLERREDKAATREDLRESELRTQLEIEKTRSELQTEIERVRAELKTDIEKLNRQTSEICMPVRPAQRRYQTACPEKRPC